MTEVLDRCKLRDSIDGPATYAGRLDPAAQGVVNILSGEDRYKKDEHLGRDKIYTVDVLVGLSTDTNDIFGVVQHYLPVAQLPESYCELLQQLVGKHTKPLPAYSGYRHAGKPLWHYAKEGVEQPEILTTTSVYELKINELKHCSIQEIRQELFELCDRPVLSGFRIPDIRKSWEQLSAGSLQIITISATVGSGTYIRSLVHEFGNLLGVPCTAYHITRTQILPTTSLL